jgi:hypothetical protein
MSVSARLSLIFVFCSVREPTQVGQARPQRLDFAVRACVILTMPHKQKAHRHLLFFKKTS